MSKHDDARAAAIALQGEHYPALVIPWVDLVRFRMLDGSTAPQAAAVLAASPLFSAPACVVMLAAASAEIMEQDEAARLEAMQAAAGMTGSVGPVR